MPGEGRRFKKGDVPNPNGPGKESNRTGRYSKACVYVAQKSAIGILRRQIKIALGQAVEQMGPAAGGALVSAKIAEQTKSAEFVFKVAKLITNDPEQTPADSVKNAEAAMAVLKLLEEAKRNVSNNRADSGSDASGLGNRPPGVQASGASA